VKNRLVVIQDTKKALQPSPGWSKKALADFHVEMTGLCGFGCLYCSSNSSEWLRITSGEHDAATVAQLGELLTPKDNPELAYQWEHPVAPRLAEDLVRCRKTWGAGKTVAFSQMTDPLGPTVDLDDFEASLYEVRERTSLRIRILTKNSLIASPRWIRVLQSLGDRVTVSLSTGTLDAEFTSRIEKGTSNPAARIRALRTLQDEGIPTYGMLCPVFPEVLTSGRLNELMDAIRPERCEFIWAEPYNDRQNWAKVREGYDVGTEAYDWFTRAFGDNGDLDIS
jgi:hypothetical protein